METLNKHQIIYSWRWNFSSFTLQELCPS